MRPHWYCGRLFLWAARARSLATVGVRTTTGSRRRRLMSLPYHITVKTHSGCHFIPKSTGQVRLLTMMGASESTSQEDPSELPLLVEEDFFLRQVETTTQKVLSAHSHLVTKDDILTLPSQDREAVGIARHLETRLQALRRNNDCPRCWMQRAHCICSQCPPVPIVPPIRRIFLILHHKEVALKVDTAKLILSAFPLECRLVVGGIGPQYQASMRELVDAVDQHPDQCLVLFPDESARTYEELLEKVGTIGLTMEENSGTGSPDPSTTGWDLVVLDGTWAQARKFHQRYFPESSSSSSSSQGGPWRVQLSSEAVEELGRQSTTTSGENVEGHQLRRHSIAWRQIGTFEATRLFLRDVGLAHTNDDGNADQDTSPSWSKIQSYQEIANRAAQKELGPPRLAQK
jgi:DTW domain-containing protein YfiP